MRYLFILMCLCFATTLTAQDVAYDSTIRYRVEVDDGNEFTGYIVDRTKDAITLKTERFGSMKIQWAFIIRIQALEKNLVKTMYVMTLPAHHTFSQATAFSLEKGQFVYQNNFFLVNQVNMGVSDRLSVGIGVLVPALYWATAKYTIPVSNKIRVGVGVLYGNTLYEESDGGGVAYGVCTFGNKERNISLGLGYGFSLKGILQPPITTLSGMIRAADHWYLIGEGYFITSYADRFGIAMVGARRFNKRTSFDLGLLAPVIENESIEYAIPWLGFSVRID